MNESYWNALSDDLMETCRQKMPTSSERERSPVLEAVLSILIYEGVKACLPEIRAWLKLPGISLILFRQKLENRLKAFAKNEELDYQKAEKAASKIVSAIDSKFLKRISTAADSAEGEPSDASES